MAYSGGVAIAPGPSGGSFSSSKPVRVGGAKPPKPASPNKPPARPKPPKPPAQNQNASRSQQHNPAVPSNPLTPLTQPQIRQQAGKTINSAYAGQFTDLNQQGKQAQNVYKTQAADDKYFASWLATQGAALESAVSQANSALAGVVTGIRNAQSAQFAQVPQTLMDQANARAGNVSNAAQSTDFSVQVPGQIANANNQVGNAAAQQAQNAGLGNLSVANLAEANQARVQALRSSQTDTLNKTLKDIANERTKLLALRTGDIAKEIARLNGVELSKAQYTQNQNLLRQQLGLKTQAEKDKVAAVKSAQQIQREKLDETNRHNGAMEAISRRKGNQAAARQREIDRHNKVVEGISQQNANSSAQRAANSGAGAKGVKGPHLTLGQQNSLANEVTAIATKASQLVAQLESYGASPQAAKAQAFAALKSGRVYAKQPDGSWAWVAVKVPTADAQLINAGWNLRQGGIGLTPGDIAALQHHGLPNPGSRFNTARNPDTAGNRPT